MEVKSVFNILLCTIQVKTKYRMKIWFGNSPPIFGVGAIIWFSLRRRFQYYRFASFRFGECFGSQDVCLDHVIHVKEVGQGLRAEQRHHHPSLCHVLQNTSDSINVKLYKRTKYVVFRLSLKFISLIQVYFNFRGRSCRREADFALNVQHF